MVTLKMLAKACGVSVATVSKAMNNAPDISAETAARVRKMADEMGYIPCAAARYLKTSRNHSFGVIFDDGTRSGLTHEHFTNMLDSFKRRAEELGYDITLISGHAGPWGQDHATHVKYRNCDGVAVLVAETAAAAVPDILRSGIPVVAVDRVFDGCSAVLSDNANGIQDLVKYIYSQGHRRIAVISGEDCEVTRIRRENFLAACRELGLDLPEEYRLSGVYHDTVSSAELTRQLLDLPEPPTCILYPDDFSFIGGKNEIERRELRIPEDISVAGYDGCMFGKVLRPRLTTIQQNTQEIGAAIASELARAVEEGESFVPRQIVIPCTLIPGGTVGKIDVNNG